MQFIVEHRTRSQRLTPYQVTQVSPPRRLRTRARFGNSGLTRAEPGLPWETLTILALRSRRAICPTALPTTSPFPCLARVRESGLTWARWVGRRAAGRRVSLRFRTRA